MKISAQHKGFLILSGILFVFNLLVMNDAISILEGAETDNLLKACLSLEGTIPITDSIFPFPKWLLVKNYEAVGFNLFLLRLPNVLVLILAMVGFVVLGKRLFGLPTILLSLVVIASNFLVVTFSKFVAFDCWLLAFELLAFISLVLLLKQPIWKWRILFWVCTLGAVLTDPKSVLVFAFGIYLFLIFTHTDGKKLVNPFNILMWLITISAAFFSGGLKYDGSGFFFNYAQTGFRDYFLISLAGVLPWIAFLPAAVLDLFQKLKKREEMAVILFSFVFFSVLSFGLILQVAFAILIAKQVENYFKPGYPHTNFVKTIAVVNLVFSFVLVAGFLLTGYDTFGEIGFRARMGLAGIYWAFGFLAIIGLFGKNKRMIVGGMALSGMLAMLMFWTQISPLLENYRSFPEKLTGAIEKLSFGNEAVIYMQDSVFDEISHSNRNDLYFKIKQMEYRRLLKNEDIFNQSGIFILDDETYYHLDQNRLENPEKIQLTGRSGIFASERKVWVVKK